MVAMRLLDVIQSTRAKRIIKLKKLNFLLNAVLSAREALSRTWGSVLPNPCPICRGGTLSRPSQEVHIQA